jgi:hypothetical protein
MLHNRILHGVLVGWGIGFLILAVFGVPSFLVYLLQAFMASRLLEAVNYFEHWGLRRRTRSVRPTDSWDTHSWFTYYGLVGLSRHADHHRAPSRPYQELEIFEEAPILPSGYLDTVDMVIQRNDEFQKKAVRELQARALGPFSPQTDPDEAARAGELADGILAREIQEPPGPFDPDAQGRAGLRAFLPRFGKAALFVLALTLGVYLEAQSAIPFAKLALYNGWILVAFILMIRSYRSMKQAELHDSLAWSLAMALLVVLGSLSSIVVGPTA